MQETKTRNSVVDGIRGLAMLLVVLGHTLSGSTVSYQDSFLFQMIWTLQMPLFIIISGYVTRYGKPINTTKQLFCFFKKRTLSYLLPWAVWTFFVRGVLFGQALMLDIKYLIWHMDSGYWFLITIWSISILFGIADYISNSIQREGNNNILLHNILIIIGMGVLLLVGLKIGLSFCCIKLTVYYIPFYTIGYTYGQLQKKFSSLPHYDTINNCIVSSSLAIWVFLISRYNFFSLGDTGIQIFARFVTSLIGCVSVIGLLSGLYTKPTSASSNENKGLLRRFVEWSGCASLSIYLVHYLVLCMLKVGVPPAFPSAMGWLLVVSNFVMTMVLCIAIIRIIESNKLLNRILFWK